MEISFWLILIGVAILIPTGYAGLIGAPYAPTRIAPVRKAFNLIGLGEKDTLVDLGVGDGKILIEAAKRGSKAYGYELSPIFFVLSYIRALKYKTIRIRYGNFYNHTFKDATVIFAFLMPDKMPRVMDWLHSRELPNLQYIVTYAFPFKDIAPQSVIREPNCAPVYVYEADQFQKS